MIIRKIEKNGLFIISLAATLVYWYFDSLHPGELISRIFTSLLFIIYGLFTQYLTNSYLEQRNIEAKYHDLVDHISDGVYRLNKDGYFTFANKAIMDLSGIPPEKLHGSHYLDIVAPEDHEIASGNFEKVMKSKEAATYELKYKTADGSLRVMEINATPIYGPGGIVGLQSISRDITDRRRMEEEIREMSMRDELTGLYNRRGFFTLAEQQLKTVNRAKRLMALTFIDVDELKWINDTLGHDKGDKALIDTATIIRQTIREADLTARIGGDEFAIIATEIPEMNPDAFSNRLQQNIDEYNANGSGPYKLAMSWGTAIYDPASPVSLDDLMSTADQLMYQKKGRNKHMIQSRRPV
jgi:diguanylate cyclase (GGDEF)-like protein/PAS domain S-box-containing protein